MMVRFAVPALVCLTAVYQTLLAIARYETGAAIAYAALAAAAGYDATRVLHRIEDLDARCVECGDWAAMSGRWCNQCEAGIRFEYDLEQTR